MHNRIVVYVDGDGDGAICVTVARSNRVKIYHAVSKASINRISVLAFVYQIRGMVRIEPFLGYGMTGWEAIGKQHDKWEN